MLLIDLINKIITLIVWAVRAAVYRRYHRRCYKVVRRSYALSLHTRRRLHYSHRS